MINKWETLTDKSREHNCFMIICNLVKILDLAIPVLDFYLFLIYGRRIPQTKAKLPTHKNITVSIHRMNDLST